MHHTYELYLTDAAGAVCFRPLTCEPHRLMRAVQAVLGETRAAAVDVREFGRSLFAIEAAPQDSRASPNPTKR